LLGDPLGALLTPVRAGYTFGGWFEEPTCVNEVSAATLAKDVPRDLAGNRTVYAKWVPVVIPPGGGDKVILTFDANYPGGTVTPPNKEYNKNDQVGPLQYLPTPTRPGYKFDGWYLDEDCTQPVLRTYVLTKDTTIYAKWLVDPDDSVLLVFDANYPGGTVDPPDKLYKRNDEVGPLQYLPTPTRPGYRFDGWYLDEACTQPLLRVHILTEDVTTVYAKWTELPDDTPGVKITVTFNPNGVDASVYPVTKEYEIGDPIGPLNFLPIPTRPGYEFDGWYYDEACTQPVLPTDIVTGNITVYAKWLKLDELVIPPWVWLLPPVLAAPLIPIIGAISLVPILPVLPVLLGGIGLLGLGGIGCIDCCWLCLRPCDECICEGKCHNPCCRSELDDSDDAKKPPVLPPKTGDSSAVMWSALTLLALSGGMAVILKRKRREEDD